MKLLTRSIAFFVLASFAAMAGASELVREFSGTKSTTTVEFTVESPWILDWHLNADYEQLVALEITLIDAKTGRHVGLVKQTKRIGNGVRLFHLDGTYRLRISATLARWRIKIEQLTDAEAELYEPR